VALSELGLIDRYFRLRSRARPDVRVGIGDDGAVVAVPPGHRVAVAVASEGSGAETELPDATALGHRVLAAALSGLAASGAEPAWATLALTLPRADPAWLEELSSALLGLADLHGVQLVGGDTTRGPVTVTVHAHGLLPASVDEATDALHPGHLLFVTGTLGDTALAILARQGEVRIPGPDRARIEARVRRPTPPVAEGIALRGLASAVVDLPDGLATGLRALLAPRGLGATVLAEHLPVSATARTHLETAGGAVLPLTSPGDAALCFAIRPERQTEIGPRLAPLEVSATWVGTVDATPGLRCLLPDGSDLLA
jgi:thiamine-monophosphate kinase